MSIRTGLVLFSASLLFSGACAPREDGGGFEMPTGRIADAGFGVDGRVHLSFDGNPGMVSAIAPFENGRIAVAGGAWIQDDITEPSQAAPSNWALAVLDEDGGPGPAFGADGTLIASHSIPETDGDWAFDVTTAGNDAFFGGVEIVDGADGPEQRLLVERRSMSTLIPGEMSVAAHFDTLASVYLVEPSGAIVAAGRTLDGKLLFTRTDASGNPDASFAELIVDRNPDALLAAVQFEAETLVLAFADGVMRVAYDGTIDSTFGGDGFREIPGRLLDVRPDPVSGSLLLLVEGQGLLRLDPSGAVDPLFGGNGIVELAWQEVGLPPFSGLIGPIRLALAPGGEIYVHSRVEDDFVLFRLHADGEPDEDFGADVLTNGFVLTDMFVQPDGKLVAAGADDIGPVVARWEP